MNRTAARKVVSSYLETPVVAILRRIGLSPNSVTLLGLVVAGASAYLLSIGNLWAGGVVLLASGMFDFFDGALARASGRASSFGALLDSVVDRLSEAAVLLGLLVYYLQQDSTEGAVLVYLALAGSIMVSYLRARAEGLGIECKVGIMTRPERVAPTRYCSTNRRMADFGGAGGTWCYRRTRVPDVCTADAAFLGHAARSGVDTRGAARLEWKPSKKGGSERPGHVHPSGE